jgi:hypothetical protein
LAETHLEIMAGRYAGLERRTQRLMNAACAPACSACAKVCCKPEMCGESLDSPFLALVRDSQKTKAAWHKQKGWLGARGCRLHAGRPPVCYEFLCQDILDDQPDDDSRAHLKDLARLLTQAGQRALGGDHMVEIMTMERLALVKPQRMAARLDRAEARLVEQEFFWAGVEAP